jgi:O-acetyl-ADP-ribose deacetylase (regulator of RNase III)
MILHVVNDQGGWGRGFVLALSSRWSDVERDYRAWASGKMNTPFALGEILVSVATTDIEVVHLLAQHGYKSAANPIPLRYEALQQCLEKAAALARQSQASVHMPRIGTGLACGDWARIKAMIADTFEDIPVFVYVP